MARGTGSSSDAWLGRAGPQHRRRRAAAVALRAPVASSTARRRRRNRADRPRARTRHTPGHHPDDRTRRFAERHHGGLDRLVPCRSERTAVSAEIESKTLNFIIDRLQIDDEWFAWDGRGFRWWAGTLA